MCPPSSLNALEDPTSPGPPRASNAAGSVLPECVPRDEMCVSAYKLAAANLPLVILNHSLRVYIYARTLARDHAPVYHAGSIEGTKHVLLFVACVLHDVGCASRFDGPQRFEVEGADAAKAHVLSFNRTEASARDVWVAIACHTSPHIAEKISPLAYLVRVGVLFDFKGMGRLSSHGRDAIEVLNEDLRDQAEGLFPRLEPEKVLGDVVVEQARRQRGKAPAASWPGILLRAAEEEPEWEGVNRAF